MNKIYTVNCPFFVHRGQQYVKGDPVMLKDGVAAVQLKNGNVIDPAALSTSTKETK